MILHQPSAWLLLLLLLLPVAWWRCRSPRRRPAVAFSSIEALLAAGPTWAARLRWIIPALRLVALALLIVCLARPQKPDEQTRVQTDAVAIQLIVDRSGSMRALDFQLSGRRVNRLDAVKGVVRDFVTGGGALPGRHDDLIGLITFATFADSRCPITLDHGHLIDTLDSTAFAPNSESGTAIGDAVALGVERLRGLDERGDIAGAARIVSRVMILLTDGENNAGDFDPRTAAEMAAAFGIRIYTIGVGTKNAMAPYPAVDPFGKEFIQHVPVSIDEDTLREIARLTGGRYFRASDTDSLQEIYARIDELEKTTIVQRRYLQFAELAIEPVRLGRVTIPALLPVVFVLLAIELLLAHTRFRVLP
jgi:Ca-activated chloride channel family protein